MSTVYWCMYWEKVLMCNHISRQVKKWLRGIYYSLSLSATPFWKIFHFGDSENGITIVPWRSIEWIAGSEQYDSVIAEAARQSIASFHRALVNLFWHWNQETIFFFWFVVVSSSRLNGNWFLSFARWFKTNPPATGDCDFLCLCIDNFDWLDFGENGKRWTTLFSYDGANWIAWNRVLGWILEIEEAAASQLVIPK